MGNRFIRRNLWVLVSADAILLVGCYYLAYLIRFEFHIPNGFLETFQRSWYFVLLIKIGVFVLFNLYRGMWRYTNLVDLLNVAKAVLTSSLFTILVVLMVSRFEGYSRCVFLIDGFLTFLAIGSIRVGIRLFFSRGVGMGIFPSIRKGKSEERRLLIIGAGDAGEKLLREIQDNPAIPFKPVGFLDDNPAKRGQSIHGIPIWGLVDEIDRIQVGFDEILIAIPSAKGEEMRRIVAACERVGKRYRRIPDIGELIGGKVSVKTIREVTIEDLLGRQEVQLDQEKIAQYLCQKRVLVTGAGGSIGSELVREIGYFEPKAVALMEMSEFNLFKIEEECLHRFKSLPITGYLTDIRDHHAVSRRFQEFSPEVVFHAAAYKHIHIQEFHPWEAVHNNVLGTRNLIDAAMKNGVDRFVLVSTDKAVRPVSVMGATKRVAEMLVECQNGTSKTRFMAVRFGNVVGSSGSVIPIFQEQIARGGPVTVTHPEVARYFMSIREAAQLILQAGAMGEGGEIFILDMGKPIRILDLAKDMIRLQGFEPELDIPIHIIGLHPGEKLCEELITEGEGIMTTTHDKIQVLGGNHFDPGVLGTKIDELLAIVHKYDGSAIKHKLTEIVSDYVPQL